MRRTLWATLAASLLFAILTSSATAQTVDIEAIVDQIEASGSFLERGVPAEADAAIQRANQQGVAFVRLDNSSESSSIAEEVFAELKSRGSQFGAVIVLTNASVYARGVGT
ncbi:MAG: hypothetical protein HKN24_12480, partial [Acidimicrobiales bacterium]|nr:hypothetical protein [Acidimicrobiales bacterium]